MLDRSRARDASYDGKFVTGVLSTGIYCLPSCPARNPRAENVRFFPDIDGAKVAGLRPCLRCCPDDFESGVDPDLELVNRLIEAVRRDPAEYPDVGSLRTAAGVGSTRLAELFRRYLHRSPQRFLAEERIAAIRSRLATGDERIADIAFAAGFESLSAFNDRFRQQEGAAPSDLRAFFRGDQLCVTLPPHYRVDDVLGFHGRDPESATESLSESSLRRVLRVDGRLALLELHAVPRGVEIACDGGGEAIRLAVYNAARRMLGLELDVEAFERRAADDETLGRLVDGHRGLTVPQCPTVFEAVVWSIVGQQVTVTFAATLRRRLIDLVGEPAGDLRAHPTPAAVASVRPEQLRAKGFSNRKAEYLIDLAQEIAEGRIDVEGLRRGAAPVAEETLLAVRGIGPWSSHYVMMRGCAFADCVPVGDTGLSSALQRFYDLNDRPGASVVRELMNDFTPYRSLATAHLWRSLSFVA